MLHRRHKCITQYQQWHDVLEKESNNHSNASLVASTVRGMCNYSVGHTIAVPEIIWGKPNHILRVLVRKC